MSESAALAGGTPSSTTSRQPRAPAFGTAAIITPWVHRVLTWGMVIYMTIYSFESPIRYLLNILHIDLLLLARDAFVDIPLVILLASQMLNYRIHAAFKIFFAALIVNGCVFYLNFGVVVPIIFGTKVLINVVLGLVAGNILINPSPKVSRILLALLIASLCGVMAEKFLFTFPWVGLHTEVAGEDLELSKDWQVEDPFSRRVGGFTHESIAAAGLLPVLAFIVAARYQKPFTRFLILGMTVFGVFLTTQKGAILSVSLVSILMMLPRTIRLTGLRVAVLFGIIIEVLIPFATHGMVLAQGGGGVFTSSSFATRIVLTWPVTLQWISDHSLFPFGVGIGGMGRPLKSVSPGLWDYPDNMFLFCLAYFGFFSLAVYGAMAYAVWRSLRLSPELVETALGIAAFLLLYGVVVSIIEDQNAALALGSAFGVMLNHRLNPLTVVAATRASKPGMEATIADPA